MKARSAQELTRLLHAWSGGDDAALRKLTPLVFSELKRLAGRYMKDERTGHTLESGALVNEAFLRLIDWKNVAWQSRAQFFAASAHMMRLILIDHARSRGYQKRGGKIQKVEFDEQAVVCKSRGPMLVALDDALRQLASIDQRKSQVVEMRFFGGLSAEETAAVLGVSANTVLRDWSLARAWLMREMSGETPE
jgi:RNA polymerase sigma factor (TIGR02999 family)